MQRMQIFDPSGTMDSQANELNPLDSMAIYPINPVI
jgi:hypothetical protein